MLLRLPAASREPSLCSWPLGPASAPETPSAFREPRRQRQRVATRLSRHDQAMQQLHPILAQTECEEAARPWNLPDFMWKHVKMVGKQDLIQHRIQDPFEVFLFALVLYTSFPFKCRWQQGFTFYARKWKMVLYIFFKQTIYIFVLQTSLWLSCGYRWRRQSCHTVFIDPKISQRFGTF